MLSRSDAIWADNSLVGKRPATLAAATDDGRDEHRRVFTPTLFEWMADFLAFEVFLFLLLDVILLTRLCVQDALDKFPPHCVFITYHNHLSGLFSTTRLKYFDCKTQQRTKKQFEHFTAFYFQILALVGWSITPI